MSGCFAATALAVLFIIIFFVSDDSRFSASKRIVVVHLIIQIILIAVFWIRDGFAGHFIYSLSVLVPFVVVGAAYTMTISKWVKPELKKIQAEIRKEIKMENDWELGSNPFGAKGSKPNG